MFLGPFPTDFASSDHASMSCLLMLRLPRTDQKPDVQGVFIRMSARIASPPSEGITKNEVRVKQKFGLHQPQTEKTQLLLRCTSSRGVL